MEDVVIFSRPNGIFYDHLVHFVVIRYICSRFGTLCRDTSGNPDADIETRRQGKKVTSGLPDFS
jgi:hypothetical protein